MENRRDVEHDRQDLLERQRAFPFDESTERWALDQLQEEVGMRAFESRPEAAYQGRVGEALQEPGLTAELALAVRVFDPIGPEQFRDQEREPALVPD